MKTKTMNHLKLMILASDPIAATDAQNAGVDRVFYDLEYIGKEARQRGRNTVKSIFYGVICVFCY